MASDNHRMSRSSSPDTPLANSLYEASTNLDDLARVLADSRATTPDGEALITCCCGNYDCERLEAWLDTRAKLSKRLILSAEVGQALLQRHEALVRRHEALEQQAEHNALLHEQAQVKVEQVEQTNSQLLAKLTMFAREQNQLEKRFVQSQLNVEVGDSSNLTLVTELQEARDLLSRLSADHARSVGWESRLAKMTEERDDLMQECASEAQKARTFQKQASSAAAKCADLQAQVFRLQAELDQHRLHRVELTEEVLQDARSRIQMLQSSMGRSAALQETEMTKVLESLVADGEGLKKDNAELQNMLVESREDVRTLKEELENLRANPQIQSPLSATSEDYGTWTPFHSGRSSHRHQSSWHSTLSSPQFAPQHVSSPRYRISHGRNPSGQSRRVRSSSVEPPSPWQHHFLTLQSRQEAPEDGHSELTDDGGMFSPTDSNFKTAHTTYEIDSGAVSDSQATDGSRTSPVKPRKRKQLMLLSQSRGVQTDAIIHPPATNIPSYLANYPISPRPSTASDFIPATPPGEREPSDTSSILDARAPALPVLIERITALLTRMKEANIRALTNRLKRQHLTGADVGHLSRSTINSILTDVTHLRTHLRASLEIERHEVSKKDLRALLLLFKELFAEMAQLRSVVNDVTLDPSMAAKLKEEATKPIHAPGEGGVEGERGRSILPRSASSGLGWIAAPISKFFAAAGIESTAEEDESGGDDDNDRTVTRPKVSGGSGGPSRKKPSSAKVVPKIGPAIGASTTTVNVEFASAGIRRAVSTVTEVRPIPDTRSSSSLAASTSTGSTPGDSTAHSPNLSIDRSMEGGGTSSENDPNRFDSLRRRAKSRDRDPESEKRRENLRGIFAGAPALPSSSSTLSGGRKESWTVIPRMPKDKPRDFGSSASSSVQGSGLGPGLAAQGGQQLLPGGVLRLKSSTSTSRLLPGGPTSILRSKRRMSQNLDAILDSNIGGDSGDPFGSAGLPSSSSGATIRVASYRRNPLPFAVPDEEETSVERRDSDLQNILQQRGLHRRGLSDSSIHTTFMEAAATPTAGSSQKRSGMPSSGPSGGDDDAMTEDTENNGDVVGMISGSVAGGAGVLRSLSKRVRDFKAGRVSLGTGTVETSGGSAGSTPPGSSAMGIGTTSVPEPALPRRKSTASALTGTVTPSTISPPRSIPTSSSSTALRNARATSRSRVRQAQMAHPNELDDESFNSAWAGSPTSSAMIGGADASVGIGRGRAMSSATPSQSMSVEYMVGSMRDDSPMERARRRKA